MSNITGNLKTIQEGFLGQRMTVFSPDRLARIEENVFAKSLYPTAIGYYPNASFHERHRKGGSEQYILLYCVGGKGWIKLDGEEEFILTPNTYYILPKNIAHSYGSSLDDPWSIYWVHFSGSAADLLYERFISKLNILPTIPYDPVNVSAFDQLFNLSESDLDAQEIEILHIRLLQFISAFIYTGSRTSDENEDDIQRSLLFMKSNLDKNMLIKELASRANYSVSRYSELFRKRTGYAPIQYFLQLKIQKSCQYLYFTKMTVKEICKEIGFDDPYYFSRMFKKQMNISPTQYRIQHQR
ncbi:AraC family transcriptional regulator [Paradesertivirga mongoliensis]|uniref:AraC family transcriptional regulator n=1 Tax=Paradesertivirga mongoliensis TaxID=2100740 RepID=A0ABW4ZRH3_9SPHI|nr:AraC family transcriptional regulator [Pedobacter mongoliensis]